MLLAACLSSNNKGFHSPLKDGQNSFKVQFLVSHHRDITQFAVFTEVSPTVLQVPPQLSGEDIMSKGKDSNKEEKKKPVMTPKEKKAAKKAKKDKKGSHGLMD